MSLFLGKIHYWLFNKILWFENLEEKIIDLAKNEGLDIENLRKDIEERYGEKLPSKPLEELIDTSNIHNWLQSQIHSAEGRSAAWTKLLIDKNKENLKNLENIYKEQGMVAAKEILQEGKNVSSPKEIFDAMNDYILDGMPCDRVNEVISNEENKITWQARIDVHKDIWDRVGCDVNYFYNLRNAWIESFVSNLNDNFKYTVDNNTKSIEHI